MLKWTGPNVKGLEFKMLLIQDINNYWLNVIKPIPFNFTQVNYNLVTNYEQIINSNFDIDRKECGYTKGCTFWPVWSEDINGSILFLSYQTYNIYIGFELSARFDIVDSMLLNHNIIVKFMKIDHLKTIKV